MNLRRVKEVIKEIFISKVDLVEEKMKEWRMLMCRRPLEDRKLETDDIYFQREKEQRDKLLEVYSTAEKRYKEVKREWIVG